MNNNSRSICVALEYVHFKDNCIEVSGMEEKSYPMWYRVLVFLLHYATGAFLLQLNISETPAQTIRNAKDASKYVHILFRFEFIRARPISSSSSENVCKRGQIFSILRSILDIS